MVERKVAGPVETERKQGSGRRITAASEAVARRKPRVVLNRQQRAEVRYMLNEGFRGEYIAKKMGCCSATVGNIKKNIHLDTVSEDNQLVTPHFRATVAGTRTAANNKARVHQVKSARTVQASTSATQHRHSVSSICARPSTSPVQIDDPRLTAFLESRNLSDLQSPLDSVSLGTYNSLCRYSGWTKEDVFWALQHTVGRVEGVSVVDLTILAVALANEEV